MTVKDESTEARHRVGLPHSSDENRQCGWSEGGKWSKVEFINNQVIGKIDGNNKVV